MHTHINFHYIILKTIKNKWYIKDFNTFDSLSDNLLKTKPIEDICDECEYVSRNATRVVKHKEAKRVRRFEVFKNWFLSNSEFERQKIFLLLNSDTLDT